MMSKSKPRRFFDEPNMSGASVLMKLEDLISIAMGPPTKNVVNFKLLQTILYILARQMRMLEQHVEIRIGKTETQRETTEIVSDEAVEKETKSTRFVDRKGNQQEVWSEKAKSTERDTTRREVKKSVRDDRPREEGRGASQGRHEDREETWSTNIDEKARKTNRLSPKEIDEKTLQKDIDRDGKGERTERDKGDKSIDKEEINEKINVLKYGDIRGKDKVLRMDEKDKGSRSGRSESDVKKDRNIQESISENSDGFKSKSEDKFETSSINHNKRRGDMNRDEDQPKRLRKDIETESYEEDSVRAHKGDRVRTDKRSSAKEKDRSKKDRAKESGMVKTDDTGRDNKSDQRYSESDEDQSESDVDRDTPKEDMERKSGRLENDARKARERDAPKKDREILEEYIDQSAKVMISIPKGGKSTSRARYRDKSEIGMESIRSEKEHGRSEKANKKSSATNIAISEVERQKEKVLVGGAPLRVGSIEVVTQSQFKLLEKAVRSLAEKAAPLPLPTMPDNMKLRSDIVKGGASLTDTMQAMQISARVQAAEKAIGRLTELLTQLAATGALPKDLAGRAINIKAEVQALAADTQLLRKTGTDSVAPSLKKGTTNATANPSTAQSQVQTQGQRKSVQIDDQSLLPRLSVSSREAAAGGALSARPSWTGSMLSSKRQSFLAPETGDALGVTPLEMNSALIMLRNDLFKFMSESTAAATTHADSAVQSARAVAQKLNVVLKLEGRVSALFSIVAEYAQQMDAYDAGLARQLLGFQEQIQQIRKELTFGLSHLEKVNNNAESEAVSELAVRYEGLVSELDYTAHGHCALEACQRELTSEMRSLVECVEMLREQKADREEVSDGLRDKADTNRLTGLLTEQDFQLARADLDMSMLLFKDKFHKQEDAFKRALKDLSDVVKCKVQYMHLAALREDTETQLQDLHRKVGLLMRLLGDPQAAVLARKLATDGACAACRQPALMAPRQPAAPPRLPAARLAPAGAERPVTDEASCLSKRHLEEPPEGRAHTCHRWVGGSHTVVTDLVTRDRAPPLITQGPGTKRYMGVGTDGKVYNLEEELLPCVECNQHSSGKYNIPGEADDAPAPAPAGAGDQVNVILAGDARRVTIVHEEALQRVAVVYGDKRTDGHGSKAVDMLTLSKSAMAFTVKSSTALDGTPKCGTGVGNIIRGRSMVVDGSAVLRTAIKHDTAARAMLVADELELAVTDHGEDERSSVQDDNEC